MGLISFAVSGNTSEKIINLIAVKTKNRYLGDLSVLKRDYIKNFMRSRGSGQDKNNFSQMGVWARVQFLTESNQGNP